MYNADYIKQMMMFLKYANNPKQMMMSMARNNPNIASVLREVEQNGGDAKELFYRKAKQLGINPEDILNQLK